MTAISTSTAKDNAVYGNAGDSFKSADGAKFKIDLAMVARDNTLINHYASNSATRTSLGVDATGASDHKLGGRYQYERSVLKNRELYLQKLTPDAVVSVTPHAPGTDVVRDAAVFHEHRRKAIENGPISRQIDAATTTGVDLERNLQQVTQQKATADAGVNQATDDRKHAQEQMRATDGRNTTVRAGRRTVRAYVYWKGQAQQATSNIAAYQAQSKQAASEIIRLKAAIAANRRGVAALTRQLPHTAPGPHNVHATSGWESGMAYNEGYNDGLRDKATVGTNKEKVDRIFALAYNPVNRNKYTPYWEGYGAALNS